MSPPKIEPDIKTQMQIAVGLKAPQHRHPSYAPNAQAPERAKHACKAPGIEPRSSTHVRAVISLWMNVAWWIIVQLVGDRLSRFDRSPHAPLLLQLYASLVHQVSHPHLCYIVTIPYALPRCFTVVSRHYSWCELAQRAAYQSCSALFAARSTMSKCRYPCS